MPPLPGFSLHGRRQVKLCNGKIPWFGQDFAAGFNLILIGMRPCRAGALDYQIAFTTALIAWLISA